jgi:phage baseplate assembly protein W
MSKYINIGFPFSESEDGQFVRLTTSEKDAIKSNLMHLLFERKGERLYKPDFGTDLLRYFFEQNDEISGNGIKESLNQTIKKYMPNIFINSIDVEKNTESEYGAVVTINYSITEGIFQETDLIVLQL